MSLSSTKRAICEKITSEFDKKIAPVVKSADDISKQISDTITDLKGISFTPADQLTAKLDVFLDDAKNQVPEIDVPGIDELLDFINDCSFLNEDDTLSNPVTLMNSMRSSALDSIDDVITNSISAIPEFSAGKLINNVQNLFSTDGQDISGIMKNVDKAIGCVENLCGSEFATKLTEMKDTVTDLYSKLNMVSSPLDPKYGELNTDSMYEIAKLSIVHKTNMGQCMDAIVKSQVDAKNAISSGINSLKGLIVL